MTNEQQQIPIFCLDKLKKHLYNTIWGKNHFWWKFEFNKKIHRKSLIVYMYYQPNSCTMYHTPAERWWAGKTFLRQWEKSSSSPRAAGVSGRTLGYTAQPGLTWRNRRLTSPTRINLEEPSGYPAQPGLTWRNRRLPSPTRINLEEP